MRTRVLCGATLLALALLPAGALVASADEDPRSRAVEAGPPLRPPQTVLRRVDDAQAMPVARSASTGRELVVLVGGYGGNARDATFEPLIARLASDPRFEVLRFGSDPRFPYDTYGSLEANATILRDQIRAVSGGYDAVHLVTHSMGGNVVDRAFARGLSSGDGVRTYVAWAAPHSGAHVASVAEMGLRASGDSREDVRAVATMFFQDPDTPAARDLARARAVRPPAGIVRLDLRLANDVMVSTADARDPSAEARILLPGAAAALDGHGGILRDEAALDLTLRTIRARAVPPDDRGLALRASARAIALATDVAADHGLLAICGFCLIAGGALSVLRRRRIPWPSFAR